MGGEWEVNFKKEGLDVKQYQTALLYLKERYGSQQSENLKFFEPNAPNNVFMSFSYACERHNWGAEHGSWTLMWDPLDPVNPQGCSNIHTRCTPGAGSLTSICCDMQSYLENKFPNNFELYRDRDDEYYNDYNYYAYDEEELDYTACSLDECGYCGKCPY